MNLKTTTATYEDQQHRFLMSTDTAWEAWARQDPYYGVVTDPKYRNANLTDDLRREFFRTGELHLEYVFNLVRLFVDSQFKPTSALDFGCGVGRVLMPLAKSTQRTVGVDVAPSMIEEATRNCAAAGITNAEIVFSDDTLSKVQGAFDFIHSCLVFQHIPVRRGLALFDELLKRLAPGGVLAVQFIYGKDYHPDTHGVPLRAFRISRIARNLLSRSSEKTSGEVPIDPATGEPEMQMNLYPVNKLLFLAHSAGIVRVHTELANHGGELGIFLLLQKPR
jgi:2-polyprenyl-3-methyl-5-hydroxy-6-metoxy-1,4-benzoquinol methylase